MSNANAACGFLVASCLIGACERTDLKIRGVDGAVGQGADADGGSADAKTNRAPEHHRPTSAVCPQERGSRLPNVDFCSPDAGTLAPLCRQDSECTTGSNGRCLAGGHFACSSSCSYDVCTSDVDCPSKAPCSCRTSGSDFAANVCVTASNCAVDADCGPGGFCSPSKVDDFCNCLSEALCPAGTACYAGSTKVPCACGDACGHGYFCHTPSDACLDDSDCQQGTCNYDRLEQRWRCSSCWPIP